MLADYIFVFIGFVCILIIIWLFVALLCLLFSIETHPVGEQQDLFRK